MNVEKQDMAARCAESILEAYRSYSDHYRSITRRARDRFVHMDWVAAQKDTLERLDLYPRIVSDTVSDVKARLGKWLGDEAVMVEIKQKFAIKTFVAPQSLESGPQIKSRQRFRKLIFFRNQDA